MQDTSRRGTHGVFGSAYWCDREKSIWSVTTWPNVLGVRLGLIMTSRINIREQRGLRKESSLAYTRRTATLTDMLGKVTGTSSVLSADRDRSRAF